MIHTTDELDGCHGEYEVYELVPMDAGYVVVQFISFGIREHYHCIGVIDRPVGLNIFTAIKTDFMKECNGHCYRWFQYWREEAIA